MTGATFKVWVSHNALSEGVREVEVEEGKYDGDVVEIAIRKGEVLRRLYIGEGIQWHRTKSEAIAAAEASRVRRIASLKKQIAKLEAMRFK